MNELVNIGGLGSIALAVIIALREIKDAIEKHNGKNDVVDKIAFHEKISQQRNDEMIRILTEIRDEIRNLRRLE